MSNFFRLDEACEGKLYEIVSIDDESISHKIGAYSGMSVVVLRKALQSIVHKLEDFCSHQLSSVLKT